VDTEPLVRTASVSWFYFLLSDTDTHNTHQLLISLRNESSRRQCPLDIIDKLIKMDEWQPRISTDGKVSSGVILLIYLKPICILSLICGVSSDHLRRTGPHMRSLKHKPVVYVFVPSWDAVLLNTCALELWSFGPWTGPCWPTPGHFFGLKHPRSGCDIAVCLLETLVFPCFKIIWWCWHNEQLLSLASLTP